MMDTFIYSEPQEHSAFLLSGLNSMRYNEPTLCDFMIKVNDVSLYCHRSVLCLFSKFIRGAVSGRFRECLEGRIEVNNISLSEMKTLLDFSYTGRLKLNHSSVESILKAATLLEFTKVVEICVEYIHNQIDHTNCLDILKLAKSNNYSSLQSSAQQYIINHVFEVFTNKYSSIIELSDVEEVLENPMSHKDSEEPLIMSVLAWLKYDLNQRISDAESLMDKIQWKRVSSHFLLKLLVKDSFLQTNRNLKQIVLEHIRQSLSLGCYKPTSNDNNTQNVQEMQVQNISRKVSVGSEDEDRSAHQGLVLVGGLNLAEAERGDTTQPNVFCYLPHLRRWKQRRSWPERGLRGFAVARFNSNVVVTGGSSTTSSNHFVINRSWMYDVASDTWQQLPDMNKRRAFHCSCQLNNRLYVVGGRSLETIDVEYYDEHKNTWTSIKKEAPRMMYNFTATSCNSKLLLIGSTHLHKILVQLYNPSVDSWTVVRSPNVPRHLSSPVSATSEDETKVFITGDNTKKMYVFHPNTNTWQRAEDMNNLHSNGSLILFGKDLIHTGGHWEDNMYWDELEIYNTALNSWSRLGSLPHLWLYHGCAAVYIACA